MLISYIQLKRTKLRPPFRATSDRVAFMPTTCDPAALPSLARPCGGPGSVLPCAHSLPRAIAHACKRKPHTAVIVHTKGNLAIDLGWQSSPSRGLPHQRRRRRRHATPTRPSPSDGPLRHVAAPPFLSLDQHTPPSSDGPLLDATLATPAPAPTTTSHRTTSPSCRHRRTGRRRTQRDACDPCARDREAVG
jgi:hypothetical protein